METILTKHFEMREHIYELLIDLALAIGTVIADHNGNLMCAVRLHLKYTRGHSRWTHNVTTKHDRALELFQTHNVSYTIGNDAPRGGEIGDYIEVPALALSDLILTLKHSVMLTVDQWSALSLNDRRNYIVAMCTLGAMVAGDIKQLSYARHLLDDDCDKIAERVMQNPIESKIYFKE